VRVLVIEDDERLADVLARGLADAGHEPAVCRLVSSAPGQLTTA